MIKTGFVLLIICSSTTLMAFDRTPSQMESIDSEFDEDLSLSKEDEDFLNDEFSPPKEAPYDSDLQVSEEQVPAIEPLIEPAPYRPIEPNVNFEQTGLKKVTAKGEYIYQVETSPQKWAAQFRIGPFDPPSLSNDFETGQSIYFSDIYGDQQNLMYTISAEYQALRFLGKFGLRIGTGFYTANGHGRFRNEPTKIAREEFTFYLFPNVLDLVYHLDFLQNQFVVPYVFGGGYYFTFVESRDDDAPIRYGGALAGNFGGGLAIKLDNLDRQAINQLDADYGVNHIYLALEYEQIIGLNPNYDFTNDFFTGGILIEF